jgi:predicted  nucleic acid-binding Zn ribbon protein
MPAGVLLEATLDTRGASGSEDDWNDALEELTGAWWCGGHQWGEALVGARPGALVVVVRAPRPDALADEAASERVRAAWARVRALGLGAPVWRQLDAGTPVRIAPTTEPGFTLFTTFLDRTSPLAAGSDGRPVPLIDLGLAPPLREDLLRWADRYQHLDALWLDSGALEVPAYRQLADPAGELMQDGRALAAQVEAACRRPVYVYLLRHYGHDLGEDDRPCPGCGRAWRQERAADDAPSAGLARFDFRCEPCRLVGHVAPSVDEHALAQVGAWSGPRSNPS